MYQARRTVQQRRRWEFPVPEAWPVPSNRRLLRKAQVSNLIPNYAHR